jgi:hypothetical protein
MRWASNVTCTVQKKVHTPLWSEYPKGRAALENLSADDGIILMDFNGTELEDVDCMHVAIFRRPIYLHGLMFH